VSKNKVESVLRVLDLWGFGYQEINQEAKSLAVSRSAALIRELLTKGDN